MTFTSIAPDFFIRTLAPYHWEADDRLAINIFQASRGLKTKTSEKLSALSESWPK